MEGGCALVTVVGGGSGDGDPTVCITIFLKWSLMSLYCSKETEKC